MSDARRYSLGMEPIEIIGLVWLLGGSVGIGTLICAFATGPIMQLAFRTVHFDAKSVRHQRLKESARVVWGRTQAVKR